MQLTITSRQLLLASLLTAAGLGLAVPAHAGDKLCQFQTKGLSMSFGALNPSSGSNVLVAVSGGTTAGDCVAQVTMTISGDNGLNYTGTRNLKNAAGSFIAYSLIGLPQSSPGPGNTKYVAFTFNGSILWSDYANAPAGTYSDTVIISVSP